jgi:uncharacterized membrane protein
MTTMTTYLSTMIFEPEGIGVLPALAMGAAIVAVVLAYIRLLRWRQYAGTTRAALLSCRLGAVVCLLLALLHPACRQETSVERRPVLAVILDDSQSMDRPAAGTPDHPGSPSRYARATDLLRQRILPAVRGGLDVRVYDVEGRPLNAAKLPARPANPRSPLTQTLLRVQQEIERSQQGLSTGATAGILLLSDGREIGQAGHEADASSETAALEQLHTPVHTVTIADPIAQLAGPADLAIEAVSANRHARVGNTVQVVLDLTATGRTPGASVPVTILDGNRVLASKTIDWHAGDLSLRTNLEFVPRRPGDLTLTAQVGPLPGETNLDNNRQSFPLSVRTKPLTVLFVDGVLRWEGKFVRQALSEDPDINVISSVRTARAGSDRGSQGLLLAEQLANVNVVILGDVEPGYFSAQEIRALRAWVTDRQGALLVTGGYHSFGPEGLGRSDLREILPVEFSAAANPQVEQPFQLKITEAGRDCPIFHLTGDRVRDAAFFQALPPLSGCSRIAGVKPGAEVLAVNPAVIAPDGSQGLPVMVVQQVGAGRTMVLAVDTTWRWRTVVGGFTGDTTFYTRFWGQIVRWLAGMDAEPPQLLFASTDRARYALQETIELNATLRIPRKGTQTAPAEPPPTASQAATDGWQVSAQAVDEKGKRWTLPLADLGNGRYRGTLGASQPGRWDLVVTAEPPGTPIDAEAGHERLSQSQVVSIAVDPPDAELQDARPDTQWLAAISQRSAGASLRVEQVEAWAKHLPRKPISVARVQQVELWHHPALATVFFAALCTEWFLRRRNRLV